MKFLLLFMSVGIGAPSLIAQHSTLLHQMKDQYGTDSSDVKRVYGLLDRTLPFVLLLSQDQNQSQGLIQYANNTDLPQPIDGTINAQGYELYEYSENAVASLINSYRDSTNDYSDPTTWSWTTPRHELTLEMHISAAANTSQKTVNIYTLPQDNSPSQVILRPEKYHVAIQLDGQVKLRWSDYSCHGSNCNEGKPNEHLENPIEFSINDEGIVIFPDQKYTLRRQLDYKNISCDSNAYFISIDYPAIGHETFDLWLDGKVKEYWNQESSRLQKKVGEEYPSHRFQYRSYGDFYISLASEEIISGYMFFRSSDQGRMITIPFNYDIAKNKFYQLRDIFKKDFDWPFFLKTYLEKQKRNIAYKEQHIVKKLIQEEPFSHMILTPSGLVFFTDFNTIFGRRHIVIPFDEILSFLDDKSIVKYIQKERFK